MFLFLRSSRRRAFRYTPGILEKNNGLDDEREKNVDSSPVPPYLAKTSSSEWNSSDDLVGQFSEQEENGSGPADSLSHSFPLPLPLKTFGNSRTDPSGIHSLPPEVPEWFSSRSEPKNGSSPHSHTSLRRWIETPAEHRLSSDASSKSGSSDQERNDLSASESDERLPSPKSRHDDGTDSQTLTDRVLPTTYFSVDNCMTDTYRAKYHKRPAVYVRAQDHMSSGESDVEGRGHPLTDVQTLEPSKSRTESGMQKHSALLLRPHMHLFGLNLWLILWLLFFQAFPLLRLLRSGIQLLRRVLMSMVSYDFYGLNDSDGWMPTGIVKHCDCYRLTRMWRGIFSCTCHNS